GAVTNTAKLEPGSVVVVIGVGGVGLNVVQGAALAGARAILAVDTVDEKLELARTFGATHFVNAKTNPDVPDRVRKLTGAPDYVFECIGLAETIQQSYAMLRKGGTAVIVGIAPMTERVQLPAFH